MKTTKTKTYVLMLAKHFPKEHPRAGQETGFIEIIKDLSGHWQGNWCSSKKHTIRNNYAYWKEVVDEVNNGKAVLSLRCWTGKPYASKQKELALMKKLAIEHVPTNYDGSIDQFIAENDGLSLQDFKAWFPQGIVGKAIIHFAEIRYFTHAIYCKHADEWIDVTGWSTDSLIHHFGDRQFACDINQETWKCKFCGDKI